MTVIDSAHRAITVTTIGFGGAVRQNVPKSSASQNASTQ